MILKMAIPIKLKVKGIIAIVNEHLTSLFHLSVAAIISIKDKSSKSSIITAPQYSGRPIVATVMGVMVVSIKIPLRVMQ